MSRGNKQHAFRLTDEDYEILERLAKKLSEVTKTTVSVTDALRSILHWFRDESPVTMKEIDAEIAAARRERHEK